MTIKHRLNKLEKLSPESKTHQISQQDCFILNGDEDCTPETCRHGCWMTESEYKAYMKQNSDMISEWDSAPEPTDEAIRKKIAEEKAKAESDAILSEILNGGL